jgi:hypothetical protein
VVCRRGTCTNRTMLALGSSDQENAKRARRFQQPISDSGTSSPARGHTFCRAFPTISGLHIEGVQLDQSMVCQECLLGMRADKLLGWYPEVCNRGAHPYAWHINPTCSYPISKSAIPAESVPPEVVDEAGSSAGELSAALRNANNSECTGAVNGPGRQGARLLGAQKRTVGYHAR